jgi:hypothetical protein
MAATVYYVWFERENFRMLIHVVPTQLRNQKSYLHTESQMSRAKTRIQTCDVLIVVEETDRRA